MSGETLQNSKNIFIFHIFILKFNKVIFILNNFIYIQAFLFLFNNFLFILYKLFMFYIFIFI